MKKIRIKNVEYQVFPYFIGKPILSSYFEFVDHDYDYYPLPILNEKAQRALLAKDNWYKHLDKSARFMVFHTLDEYINNSDFNKFAADVCSECEFVFGHQLPITLDQEKYFPILYPSLIGRIEDTNRVESTSEYDICFWGAYNHNHNEATISAQVRERDYRASVIGRIQKLCDQLQLISSFKPVYYWKLSETERTSALREYKQALLKSKLCLSLYGHGYNSFRNSEIWGIEKCLISSSAHKHVLVPEPEKWEDRSVGFFFRDDCSDLEQVIVAALSQSEERKEKAEAGLKYFDKYCTPKGIANFIFEKLRSVR